MKRLIRVAITSGDTDGVGLEVVSKALSRLGKQAGVQFYLWRAPSCSKKDLRRIDRSFKRVTVASWPEALRAKVEGGREIVDIASNLSPAHWVEASAQAAKLGHIDGLATAPLSKTAIHEAGMTDIGHTDILKRVSKCKDLYMCFVGKNFSVVLATGHVSLEKVTEELDETSLMGAIKAAAALKKLQPSKDKRSLALVGLNPHAGEGGLIGSQESTVFKKVLERLKTEKIEVAGPLVPDVAFTEANWKKYSVYVASYHDQGLIPFKMVHKRHGVHITMGLPFVRTSVDHGTAKDIFGKNLADYHSMLEALKWSVNLCRSRVNSEEQ
jgi:4-hydroxythreonine-4-phosphate dehydrogenase